LQQAHAVIRPRKSHLRFSLGIDKVARQRTLAAMKLRHVIVAITLLLAVVTGGAIAGAMMLPAAAGAEVELSSLEGKIRDINLQIETMTRQLEEACNQLPPEIQQEQAPQSGVVPTLASPDARI
jgi:hypothetical protein